MRKLTVKNFSVIKEAELEFGKITVLIGPQSSGKSLLCKLAYFFSKELLELAVESISQGTSVEQFKTVVISAFVRRFSIDSEPGTLYAAEFEAGPYSAKIFGTISSVDRTTGDIGSDFSEEFKLLYDSLITTQLRNGVSSGISATSQMDEIWTKLNRLLSDPVVSQSTYIPAGRVFFTNTSLGFKFNASRNPDIDSLITAFAAELAWGRPLRRVGQVTAGDDVLDSLKQTMDRIAGGEVKMAGNVPVFAADDGRFIDLSRLSSGTQELLPLFNVLGRLASEQEAREVNIRSIYDPPREVVPVRSKPIIYVEEPETSVFPSTQYDLVRLFARLSYEHNLDFSWVITTHSPYILSSFNNLLEAWQVGHTDEERGKAIREIIDEKYWVNPQEFRAYSIKGGYLDSIMDKETHLISDNFLDSVSERIGGEFDQLLRIGYVEA